MTYSETEKEILESFDNEFDIFYGYADFCPKKEFYHQKIKASLKKISMATAESFRVEKIPKKEQEWTEYDSGGFNQAVSEMQEKERIWYE